MFNVLFAKDSMTLDNCSTQFKTKFGKCNSFLESVEFEQGYKVIFNCYYKLLLSENPGYIL